MLVGPAVFAHVAPTGGIAASLALGIVVMSLTASAGYLVNDVIDRRADQAHPLKRKRPIAAGLISVPMALAVATVLALLSAGLSMAFLGGAVALLLAGYLFASIAYSTVLKTLPLVDVAVLASLYMWRLAIGGAIAGIVLSGWLIAFGFSLFMALALTKRLDELSAGENATEISPSRRFYGPQHKLAVLALCIICAVLAAATLVGYVSFSRAAVEHYRHHAWLWTATALLAAWMIHMLGGAMRGKLDGDPVLFSLSDPLSLALVAGTGLSLVAAV